MAEMKVEIPQDVIRSIVQAQVVAALGKSENLIEGVVARALSQKRDSYGVSTTIFEEEVTKMIRDVAVEAFKEWLAENREKIRAEMRRQLTVQKGRILTDLVSKFTENLSSIYASITLQFPND